MQRVLNILALANALCCLMIMVASTTDTANAQDETRNPTAKIDIKSVSLEQSKGEFLRAYCFDCHDSASQEGQLDLENISFDLGSIESAERWQKVRKMQNDPTSGPNQDIEDALKSLGLRTPTGQANQIRESADSLQGIRDSGNRQPPPAAYRDAFDAFRRAMGRGK